MKIKLLNYHQRLPLMSLSILFCLSCVTGGCSTQKEKKPQSSHQPSPVESVEKAKSSLASALLDAIPEPEKNEFPTADSVLKHAFESLRNGNLEEYLKCFPIRAKYQNLNLEGTVKATGYFDLQSVSLAHDDYLRLHRASHDYISSFYGHVLGQLWNGEGLKTYERIDLESEQGRKRLAEIKKMLDLKRLQGIEFGQIEKDDILNRAFKDGKLTAISSMMKTMGATDICYLKSSLKLDTIEVEKEAIAFRFKNNWKLYSLQ